MAINMLLYVLQSFFFEGLQVTVAGICPHSEYQEVQEFIPKVLDVFDVIGALFYAEK